MKNFRFIAAIFVVSIFSVLNSCSSDVEPVDPAVLNPNVPDCARPVDFHVSDFVNDTSINLYWTAGGTEAGWQVEYGPSGFVQGTGTTVDATDNYFTITGLDPAVDYVFYVRSACSDDSFSNWVGPVGMNEESNDCPDPGSLTAARSTTTTTDVTLHWTPAGSESSWKVQYGPTGFDLGTGTTVTSDSNVKVISGISATQGYDFYIRAACSASEGSGWVGPVNVIASAAIDYGFMNANVFGSQHDHMMPLGAGFTDATSVVIYGDNDEFPYLRIQGDSSQDPALPTGSFEINLWIPESQWGTGTYSLLDPDDVAQDGTESYVHFIQNNSSFISNEILNGVLTITEFNETTRRIKGTFSFDYKNTDATGTLPTINHVTGGTFDYELDAPYFD